MLFVATAIPLLSHSCEFLVGIAIYGINDE